MTDRYPKDRQIDHYLRQAEEADAYAQKCTDPAVAEAFRRIAKQWRDLAKHAARLR